MTKILVAVYSEAGEFEGFRKAKLQADGMAKIGQEAFVVKPDSKYPHKKKRKWTVTWQRGQPETAPRPYVAVHTPAVTPEFLDMVANNNFYRNANESSRGGANAGKIAMIAVWVLVAVVTIAAFAITNELNEANELAKALLPQPPPGVST